MDGEQHDQEQRGVPRAGAVPPPPPAHPPKPPAPPGTAVHPLVKWLRMPRPEAGPGIWRVGHTPRAAEEPGRVPTRQLLFGALASALVGWLVWALLWNGYLGPYWFWPVVLITPNDKFQSLYFVIASWTYYVLVAAVIAVFFGRLGGWPELVRRARTAVRQANATAAAAGEVVPPPEADPALWPQLRSDGAVAVADVLSAELREGRMTDVDYARIDHAWRTGRARTEIAEEVRAHGAAACVHGSGARDLPMRTALHDLPLSQVRIGSAVDSARNPFAYRAAGIALEPAVLGTSALVVGPSGREPAEGVVGPVVESLCLQALAGQAAVVAVTSSGSASPQGGAFDVVLRAGDPAMAHSLDLYAGLDDADEAAVVLAEALVGDLSEVGGDSRWAATALAQLLGPWRAVHDRFPGVDELRDLLDDETARTALRATLDERGASSAHLRELDAYERRAAAPGGAAETLSTRVALLDRPVFQAFLTVPGTGSKADDRSVFSLQHLDRPVRVRIDLPERVHTDASRILARLILAQFTVWATGRRDQTVFAFLVLEDAVQTITAHSLRGLQGLRRNNAGVLFSLRNLSDIPEGLRDRLLAAVGCRVACVGVSPWDAQHFATAWGTEWVETEMVTHRQVRAEEPMTKVWHALKKVATGQAVTTKSVTMRREERQRWSASDLANELQAGQAVISVTAVNGERMPPILTKLK